ncbi:hypothetical protein PENSPDRAFT_224444 [Peniophora sp. CONT]|nr:hypothetical protein PENSPDRAFT_224444 [Peniophora sp. CONT]
MPGSARSAIDDTFQQLQKRMVESGDWDRILLALKYRLSDECWLDIARGSCKERARQGTNIRDLIKHISDTHGQVPDAIRAEFLKIIKKHLAQEVQL